MVALSLREAQALTQRLFHLWEIIPHETSYAARIVAVAERAHQRQIRRAAQCGDPKAQHWLALLRSIQEGKHDPAY